MTTELDNVNDDADLNNLASTLKEETKNQSRGNCEHTLTLASTDRSSMMTRETRKRLPVYDR